MCVLSLHIYVSSFLTVTLAKLSRRDPRMVERKKTGLAKARKRVRPSLMNPPARSHLSALHSTPGSSVNLVYVFIHFLVLQYLTSSSHLIYWDIRSL